MANITVRVSGGRLEEFSVSTLGTLKEELDLVGTYSYAVNGVAVTDDDYAFTDYQRVDVTENIKSGR